MKNNYILAYILMAFLALSLVWSCNTTELEEQATGYLSVSLGQDDSEDIVFKSVSAPAADQVFTLDFIRTYKYGSTKSEYTCRHTEIPAEGVKLPVGPYQVKAFCGENKEAAFGEPFYTGETSVNIIADTEHSIDITCYLSNVKVTVDFSDEIIAGFNEYTVTVANSRGGSLTFSSKDGSVENEGYFKVGEKETLTWTLNLTNTKGVTYSASETYTDVKAREHYNLKFALGEARPELGGLYLTIKVDNSTEVKEYLAGVDFGNHAAPVLEVNDEFGKLLANDPVTVPFGVEESKVVTLTAGEGIKSAVIAHSDAKLYAKGLPYMTELVGASSTALAALKGIGITATSSSYGSSSPLTVDVTKFMASLDMDQNYCYDIRVYDVYNHMASKTFDFTVVVDADADMVSVNPWAKFAIVTGKWFLDDIPDGLTFMYKKVADSEWKTVDNSIVTFDYEAKTFTAEITGLDASTEYYVKAVSSADSETREMKFTTEIAHQLYNMNFDIWDEFGKTWYPYLENATEDQKVWDSANPGTADYSAFVDPNTTPETSDVVSGKAVKMESVYAFIKFAAGNIYTGKFGSVIGTEGAELDWGTPFTGRPVALRGYYKYSPALINYENGKKVSKEDKPENYDKCQILVILTDWDKPFHVNTVEGHFVDFENDSGIIGFAKYESNENVTSWKEFCLPIEYRDTERIPTYAIVVCCSSYLGDYFTGGQGSTMWADEFSFEYDITELDDEQKAKVNYK